MDYFEFKICYTHNMLCVRLRKHNTQYTVYLLATTTFS